MPLLRGEAFSTAWAASAFGSAPKIDKSAVQDALSPANFRERKNRSNGRKKYLAAQIKSISKRQVVIKAGKEEQFRELDANEGLIAPKSKGAKIRPFVISPQRHLTS